MNQKDIKLLWGRAGNRCAICKFELAQDAISVSASYTLGEQAHIVGEKEGAPRGNSLLSDEQRNSYHNIILLCPNHHTEIDKNEFDWPIEKLHFFKSQHELWVRETLAESAFTTSFAQQVAVTTIIDATVDLCALENWKGWTSGALAPDPNWDSDMPERLFEFRQRVAAAIWPQEFDDLKRATTTLAVLLHNAVAVFMEHSSYAHGRYWPHKFYKAYGFNPNYQSDYKLYEQWVSECHRLIKQASCAANWFADVVRRDINPMFFAERGKFVVMEGPFEDLNWYASIPEFSEQEKCNLPDSLF